MKPSIPRDALEPWVAAGLSSHAIAAKLGCSQKKVWRNCKAHNLELASRRTGVCEACGARKARSRARFCSNKCQQAAAWLIRKRRIEELGGAGFGTKALKRFVLERDGHRCSVCRVTVWQGLPIPLVLDHVDGNSENCELSNLRYVCGNCDMQLPTYKNRNRGSGRAWRRRRYAEGKSY